MEIKQIIDKLLKIPAPSGSEINSNKHIKAIFTKYCDELISDKLGNVIGIKRGLENDFKIMLAAHMDEIGLMVKNIDESGFIRFTFIGGVDNRILPAQEVVIHGRKDVYGIIGSKPPHIQQAEERKKSIKPEDMFIDTGLSSDEVNELISIGDYITFYRSPSDLLNNSISANALDNRAGIATVLWALKELENLKFYADIYAVATTQEEVGLRGAITSSFEIYPDIGIAIDVCHGNMKDVPEPDSYILGNGPTLALGPNIHPRLFNRLKNLAEEYKIPYQIDVEPSNTGTDAWAIQITRAGIPTALISIPLRYMHTTVETIRIDDIKMSGRLLALFISSIHKNFVEELSCF
ncbi:MAG TPA: M42 family metallopeptidase [Thermoanaerobacterales bacterium]|nr:M42 family metallopeptidase [Thermoanaerobacterales bacterium]